MSRKERVTGAYVIGGDPDAINESALYKPGELGARFTGRDPRREYQLVQVDSGATADASPGVVATGDLAFWKDKSTFLVTNDLRFSKRNHVAGIFRNAVTAGNYTAILQKGNAISVNAAAGGVDGDVVIANSGTDADATFVTEGTASTHQRVGIARGATAAGFVSCDVDIENQVE